MPKLDLAAVPASNRANYPGALAEPVRGRWNRRLGEAGGLADLGVSHVRLEPGAWSSQRHWHELADEFVVILSGEAVLVEEGTRTPMRAGDCAVFPKGAPNGHHLINEGETPCVLLAIGTHAGGACHYPDVDLFLDADGQYRRKDGSAV